MSDKTYYFTRTQDHNQTVDKYISGTSAEKKEFAVDEWPYFLFDGEDTTHILTASQKISTKSPTWYTDSDKWNSTKLAVSPNKNGSLYKLINAANKVNNAKENISLPDRNNQLKINQEKLKEIFARVKSEGTVSYKTGTGKIADDVHVTIYVWDYNQKSYIKKISKNFSDNSYSWNGEKNRVDDPYVVSFGDVLKDQLGEEETSDISSSDYTVSTKNRADWGDSEITRTENYNTFLNGKIIENEFDPNGEKIDTKNGILVSSTFNWDSVKYGSPVSKTKNLKEILERIVEVESDKTKDFTIMLNGDYVVKYKEEKEGTSGYYKTPYTRCEGIITFEDPDHQKLGNALETRMAQQVTLSGWKEGPIKYSGKLIWNPTSKLLSYSYFQENSREKFENNLKTLFKSGEYINWGGYAGKLKEGDGQKAEWGLRRIVPTSGYISDVYVGERITNSTKSNYKWITP